MKQIIIRVPQTKFENKHRKNLLQDYKENMSAMCEHCYIAMNKSSFMNHQIDFCEFV